MAKVNIEALQASSVGTLVRIVGTDRRWGVFDHFAFVPKPLPRTVPLAEPTISAVADAAMALGRLDVGASTLPNPALLVRPVLTKEALSTSALEGTYAPLTEVLEGDLVGREEVSPEAREVLNYVAAAELGIEMLKDRPISLNLFAELQKVLARGTRGDSFDAGQLRKRQVVIGSHQAPVEKARFVPAPPGEALQKGISDWEKWIHEQNDTHLLVKVALAHYQFETLHPFSDGNGRLGRLLVTLQLIEGGVLTYPLLNISEWLEPRKDEYFDRLLNLSIDGDFDSWVFFFATGIKEQAEAAGRKISRLLDLGEGLIDKVRKSGSRGGTSVRIAEQLIGYPILDIALVAKLNRVGYQSARQAVLRLTELGILHEVKRGRRRLFLSDEVLEELED